MDGNQLFGSINWTNNSSPYENSINKFRNKSVDISINKIKVFDYNQQYYSYNADKKIFCTVLGCVNNLTDIKSQYNINFKDIESFIIHIYCQKGISEFSKLDGVFLVFLFDETIDKGYIYQPFYGMDLPIYYHLSKDKFTFSTNLKNLILSTGERNFNVSAAKDALHTGNLVPTKNTLIQNIFKVLPGTYLEVDRKRKKEQIFKLKRSWKPVTIKNAKENLTESIHNNFNRIYNSLSVKDVAITHTKGWDTNLLLYYTSLITTDSIKAVTINGGDSVNEVPFVKEIQKEYRNIVSLIGEVKSDFDQLINLVWVYEGYLFQEGFFLRYELAKILQNESINSVVVGACGDQLLFPPKGFRKIIRDYPDIRYFLEFFLRRHNSKERLFRKQMPRTYRHLRFFLEVDWLLKMHSIVLNHHGIQAIYPYLNRKTEWYSRRLGYRNYKKKYYKSQVKQILPERIVQHISKSKNVVDSKALFQIERELLQKLLSSNIVLSILNKREIREISKSPEAYVLLVLQLLSLFLFNELFISGKFDSDFDKEKLNVSLDDLNL